MKQFFSILAATIFAFILFYNNTAYAEETSVNDLSNQISINDANQEQSLKQKIMQQDQANQEIEVGKKYNVLTYLEDLKIVKEHLSDKKDELEDLKQQIKDKKEDIKGLDKKIEDKKDQKDELDQKIEKRQEKVYPFDKPAEGKISSGFKQRWGKHHDGVDIAKGGKNTVHAAHSGIVTKSYLSSSYGQVVFVKHEIKGEIWETVYAHMRKGSQVVNAGDKVSQGDKLGIMGSTGHSTGQHLHFEVHKGRWNYSKTNAVNPIKYTNNL